MKYLYILASSSVLDASKGVDLGQFIQVVFGAVCLAIDSVVYWVTSIAFKLFLAISQFELFNTSTFNDIINRAYIVIGVVSLFLVAYALLNAIINPDNFSKGDKSISKIVKNLIISIIGIAIVPTIFNYFYYFQKVILCNNTIPKILLKGVSEDGNTVENTAKEFSALVFESFFYPNATSGVGDEAVDLATAANEVKLKRTDPYYSKNKDDSDYNDDGYYSLSDAYFNAERGRSFWISFSPFLLGEGFANAIVDNSVQYLVILSTIAGGYIAYVMISLCIDMGMRAVKLGYLELIAPLALMTTIVPGKDSVCKTWLKKTTSCALEVFTRLFVVVFAVYLINTIKDMNLPAWISSVCGITLWPIAGLLLRTLVIASIFAFIKQAPKFFSEATGIKSDGFKIGIMDKLKENGMLQGLGAAGAAATTGVRNIAPGVAKGFATGGVRGAIKSGLKSGLKSLPESFKAGQKGWNKVKEAKKWSDVKSGVSNAATEAEKEHLEWEDYKKNHGGTFRSAIAGKADDRKDELKDYWTQSHQANYAHEHDKYQKLEKIISAEKAINDKAKALMNDNAHKIQYTDEHGVQKTLQDIRKDEEVAQQKLNAAIQAEANVAINGTQAEKAAARAAVNNARNEFTTAHSHTVKVEKMIKTAIKRGTDYSNPNNSEAIKMRDSVGAANLQDVTSLYNEYQTTLKDNVSAITDKETHDTLSNISEQTPEAFRNTVINSETLNNIRAFDENGTPGNYSAADAVKLNAAKVASVMNREGEAARKQQEGKK